MSVKTHDLWKLVKYRPQIDPDDLSEAVRDQAEEDSLDYRTRLLIRDSVQALRDYWDEGRFQEWLANCPARVRIEAIWREDFERPGFPSLRRRLMEKTDPEDIRRYLREIGTHIRREIRVPVGGSAALILRGQLQKKTDDIDIVDEVPEEIRNQHTLLHDLESRYGLKVGHFQRHYLPMRWENRLHYGGAFGRLQVDLVDAYDVFLSSIREKDKDDLRTLAPQLDKEVLARMLKEDCASMLAAPDLRQRCEQNWYILYGEPLPA